VRGAPRPYADRLAVIGDCGESRLYKDGIGGAYRTAKAAAKTAVFEGVSARDFQQHFMPVCRDLAIDNAIGRLIFAFTGLIQALRFTRLGILRMIAKEQRVASGRRRMSGVLWDMFTGSAPYRDVFRRTLHPMFGASLIWEIVMGFFSRAKQGETTEVQVSLKDLGRVYRTGETIIRQGEVGDCMYVIQAGKVEVIKEDGGREVSLAVLGEGDYFGEMAIFEKDVRSATVRPVGEVRVLTIDRKMFLQKIHQDPSLAFRIMQKMSHRIRDLDNEVTRLTEWQSVDAQSS